MSKLDDALAWANRPHWTPRLRRYAVVALVLLTAYLIRDLWSILACLATLAVLFGSYKAVTWFIDRRKLLLELGAPLRPARMVWDFARTQPAMAGARQSWQMVMHGQKVQWNGMYPQLYKMHFDANGQVRAMIAPGSIGGDVQTISKLAADDILSGAMKCREVSLEPASEKGTAWITFHTVDPLRKIIPVLQLPLSGPDRLSFGIEQSGECASMPLGYSVLIGGATKAGKSSDFWALFFDLVRDGTHCELYVVDPKRLEMVVFKDLVGKRIGNVVIKAYTTDVTEAKAMIDMMAATMHKRQEQVYEETGERELTTPTERIPARCFLVDEMLDMGPIYRASPAEKREGLTDSGTSFGIVLSQGRATKDFIIAICQLAKVNNLGDCRDLFPLRKCFRTMTEENTKAILGVTDSEAPCTKIPFGAPGTGYYVTDTGLIRKFRSAYTDTKAIKALLSTRELPKGMLTRDLVAEHATDGRACSVYIAPDINGDTVYVGKAFNVKARSKQHRRAKVGDGKPNSDIKWCDRCGRMENFWVEHVIEENMIIKTYASEAEALKWEEHYIEALMPWFNVAMNADNPRANMTGGQVRTKAGRGRHVIETASSTPDRSDLAARVAEDIAAELAALQPAGLVISRRTSRAPQLGLVRLEQAPEAVELDVPQGDDVTEPDVTPQDEPSGPGWPVLRLPARKRAPRRPAAVGGRSPHDAWHGAE